ILPLLNGIAHLDALTKRFAAKNVLGGQVGISVTLDPEGRILHLNDAMFLSYGELDGTKSPRVEAIAREFAAAKVPVTASATALLDMWEKWVLIASVAGITCLMRSAIGDVLAAGGQPIIEALHGELIAIATANGFAPRPDVLTRHRALLLAKGSPFTASMLRDIEGNQRIEADHVIGDLLARGKGGNYPVLTTAFTHLKAYEARRARTAKV
ncbi:MAG: oxidoreductase, partial [Alphaproteobacteria bacterium]|nr:oxidoreductase [Alphaproteobacteria bacterium]